MMRNVYGYIRVSTKEQNEDRQWLAMKEYGVPEGNVYVDKQSGKDFDRPGYRQVLEVLCENDVLVIKSIDRLGRHFDELLEQWRIITVEKKAGIIVLDLPILNVGLENDLLGNVHPDCGHCAANPQLCGPEGAGEHPAAAGGGHRGGAAEGRPPWQEAEGNPGGV